MDQMTLFNQNQGIFKDAKYTTAKEKEKAYKTFKKIIDNRDMSILDKNLYEHLHLHCSFIAHYDQNGFVATYSDTEGFKRFITHFIELKNSLVWGDYKDINGAMVQYVEQHYEMIMKEISSVEAQREIRIMKALAEKHGYKVIPA